MFYTIFFLTDAKIPHMMLVNLHARSHFTKQNWAFVEMYFS